MEHIDVTIVGAGVVGLAIAHKIAREDKSIFVVDKHPTFGCETSSRNSEVIHAGIYYPKDSLKAKTCLEGNRLLYEICQKNSVPYKRLGKLIVAVDNSETNQLESLYKNAKANGIEDLEFIAKDHIRHLEPNIDAQAALYSPSTGILDSHKLMEYFLLNAKSKGAQIVYNCEVKHIEKIKDSYKVTTQDADGEQFIFYTAVLINSAGLYSDRVSLMAGIKDKDYCLRYCKGEYFRLNAKKAGKINRLVYPVPKQKNGTLGIHATPGLTGSVRLGPDDEYIEQIDYSTNPKKRQFFYDSVKMFLPFVEPDDLTEDIAGIRPKLQGENEPFRDFVIRHEEDKGFGGFINLIGIESPGLTSSPSIANYVKAIVDKLI